MKLFWSNRARADLLAIFRYIADDDPVAATAWVKKLRLRAAAAARSPGIGRWLPERLDRRDLREVIFKGYRIVYTVAQGKLIVLTVFEGHRRLPADL
ncbi:MAG: type II toxin-antitoxin system RelE/ParE family toxin [Myxococcales bacterium]|nr:type II toxin-antitoxin system RelE/ParE family toxin [Myxococcales bacterium]